VALEPGKLLENAIRTIDTAFRYAGVHYWLHFGALYGMALRDGTIPDADFDCCVYYGSDWMKIVKSFESYGYTMSKAIVNDTDSNNIMYCGFNKPEWPHVCVSFWYLHDGIRYYCHDTHHELKPGEIGIPASGYYFKGFPDFFVSDKSMFKRVEWPGINQSFKVSVPVFPLLDYMYPGWPFVRQKYTINKNQIEHDKMCSIRAAGAISPHMVHLTSMRQWNDTEYIKSELRKGEDRWRQEIKKIMC